MIPDHPESIPIGSIVSFSYMEMTKDGVPRHPVYRGIRDDIQKPKSIPVKKVIQLLTKIMNKISASKEPNWQFKIKYYKQAISILDDKMELSKVEDYIKVFRENGMVQECEQGVWTKGQFYTEHIEVSELPITACATRRPKK